MNIIVIFTLFTSGILTLFVISNPIANERINVRFIAAIITTLLLLVVTKCEHQLALLNHVSVFRKILTALGYIMRNFIIYFLFSIVQGNIKQKNRLYYIPIIINIIICLLSIPFGIVFDYTADNLFVRGPLYFIPFLTSLVYLLFILKDSAGMQPKKRSDEILIGIGIVAQIILTVILGFQSAYQDLIALVTPVSLVFYYMYLNTLQYKVDRLTGALNRNCFDLDYIRLKKLSVCALIMADLNNLKEINDTYGHHEGDIALQHVVGIMRKYLSAHAHLYRFGGDEFLIVWKNASSVQVENYLKKVKDVLRNSKYSVSFGYYIYRKEKDIFRNAIAKADQIMYENKKHDV